MNALGREKHSWRQWTEFFLNAVTAQAKENAVAAESILALYERLKEQFMQMIRSRYAVPLFDAAFQLQYFQPSQLEWKGEIPSKPTLMNMLRTLEKNGVIQEYRPGAGRRSSIWWLPELITVVEKSG